MEYTPSNEISQVTIYNPNEIIGLFSESLAKKNPGVIYVRGIYKRGNNTNYGGYYYDILKDEFSQYELSIKITPILRENLEEGNLVDMKGLMERRINNECKVQLVLNVTGVVIVQEQTVSEEELRRIEIRKKKAQSGFRKVDNILEGSIFADRRPSVGLIFADSSITDADFDAGKEAAEVQIDFLEYRVSFAQPAQFVKMLKYVDNEGHDIICIVRGGGSGLDTLENLDVLDCIAGMETAVITAVGHTSDKVFINEISDLEIGTPSLLGSYFKDLVERVAKKKADSTASLTKKIEAQFKEQIETSKKQNEDLQKKIAEMTKNASESTKKHDEQVKAAAELSKKQMEDAVNANAALQKKLEEITKASSEANKAHDEQMKAAQNQNKQLQEQIVKLNATAAESKKTSKEQMEALQGQLKTINDANQKQSSEFSGKLGKMQETISRLTEENSMVTKKLIEANSKCTTLERQLQEKMSNKRTTVITWILIGIIFLLIICLII